MQINKWTPARVLLVVFLLVLGLGALAPGWLLFTRPDGSGLGMPASMLSGSLFPDYTIPGLVLFTVFGVGSLVVAFGVVVQPRWRWTELLTQPFNAHWSLVAAALIGIGQMIWIVVETIVIRTFSGLQPAMFIVGLAILVFAVIVTKQHRPAYAR